MKMKSLLITLLLVLTSTFAVASDQEVKDPKYDGIEIVVNVNQASAQEIADMLKGIGLKKAQAIVDYRQQQGPFKQIEDLAKVQGIGEATVAKNIARIKL
ncbi:ComEA family DNA-binding protein [Vibrio fluminensis]|uniref:ComEA family DNA-binding protein n=1 Tax=Vibrio fluminensis TaxID=2783614 RepID=UPI001887AAE1|nr:helix-hairpin-helix domain-containing protein [Vibrio fluminensis]